MSLRSNACLHRAIRCERRSSPRGMGAGARARSAGPGISISRDRVADAAA